MCVAFLLTHVLSFICPTLLIHIASFLFVALSVVLAITPVVFENVQIDSNGTCVDLDASVDADVAAGDVLARDLSEQHPKSFGIIV